MKLGSFTTDSEGQLMGRISALGMGSTPVVLSPSLSKKGETYFKLIADPMGAAYEIGAAFPKMKDGKTYHSVMLDSPLLNQPMNAALFQNAGTGTYSLVWDRAPVLEAMHQPKPAEQAAAKTVRGRAPAMRV